MKILKTGEGAARRGSTAALFALTLRNLKVFVKDRANVFFSLMAPPFQTAGCFQA